MELGPELKELQRNFSDGHVTRASALDSLSRLQATSYRKHIRPFHSRGLWAAAVGMVLLAIWGNVEFVFLDLADVVGQWMELLPVIGIASFIISIVHFSIYFKRFDDNVRWFNELQSAIESGRMLTDSIPDTSNHPSSD